MLPHSSLGPKRTHLVAQDRKPYVVRLTLTLLQIVNFSKTASALSVFLLAMVLYPDVMRRAQVEIDDVVGRGRLPNFGDQDTLPYINAMLKEVLRWRPVVPLGESGSLV